MKSIPTLWPTGEFHVSSFCSFLGSWITGRKTTNKNVNQKEALKKYTFMNLKWELVIVFLNIDSRPGPSHLCS